MCTYNKCVNTYGYILNKSVNIYIYTASSLPDAQNFQTVILIWVNEEMWY